MMSYGYRMKIHALVEDDAARRTPAARFALLQALRFPVNEDGTPGDPLISDEDYLRLLDCVDE